MKKYPLFYLAFILIAVTLLYACKKSSPTPPGGGGSTDTTGTTGDFTDIYVGGFLNNGTKQVPAYWKNGTPVMLSDKDGEVRDITVDDNGIVLSVGEVQISGHPVAAYWENSAQHLLSDEFHFSLANSIKVVYYIASTTPDTTYTRVIFIGGWQFEGGTQNSQNCQAGFWRDGDANFHNFTSTKPSVCLDMAVAGTGVNPYYGCGILDSPNDYGYASVWGPNILGTSTYLSNVQGSRATAMTLVQVFNNAQDTIHYDVYTCGHEKTAGGVARAAWWYNGEPRYFTNGVNYEYATDIKVVKDKVYACGYGRDSLNGFNKAKYWTNDGTEVKLTDGTKQAFAYNIAVKGDNILVCGVERSSPISSINIAKYWKNGVAVNLSDGVHNAIANAIYAK